MTKLQFKTRWESTDEGGGITFDEIAECAKLWGITSKPRIMLMDKILYEVLKVANTKDAESYKPQKIFVDK